MEQLTGILGVLGAYIIIARVQNVLVHERRARCHLSEERDLDGLSDLDTLALLHKDLARVLAPVLAVQGWYAILLGVVTLLEGLKSSHEVMPSGDTMRDDTFCDTCRDGTLDDGGDGVHRPYDFVLELWRHVELDLLEKIL